MEQEILDRIGKASEALETIRPLDGRTRLKKISRGKRWRRKDVRVLRGMVWHQELGWGSVEAVTKYHTREDSHLLNPVGSDQGRTCPT